ncbi:hypothetical protein E2C01_002479 [Portunus trituberculatus]|uniref:Uncharacterized protein n=1 Tax=Portunus trituberculatus TaxID=210409 RepID=A0A5B7CM10_PORTR|nr:hypothetical protein [Portunus trituberculatus]
MPQGCRVPHKPLPHSCSQGTVLHDSNTQEYSTAHFQGWGMEVMRGRTQEYSTAHSLGWVMEVMRNKTR